MADSETSNSPSLEPNTLVLTISLSGVVLLGIIAAIAVVLGCIIYCNRRYSYHRHRNTLGPIVHVVPNTFISYPVPAEDTRRRRCLFVAPSGPVEKRTDGASQSSGTSHHTPSYSDSYSTHFNPTSPSLAHSSHLHQLHPAEIHPPYPMQAHSPLSHPSQPAMVDSLRTSGKSCRSNPDEVLSAHPHWAPQFPKSVSYNAALNKSYCIANDFGIAMTTRISVSNPSLCSSCVSHVPIQAERSSSPGSGRLSISRRFFSLGSFRSAMSDQEDESWNYENPTYTHFETPL